MPTLIAWFFFLIVAKGVSGQEVYPLVSFGPPGPQHVSKISDGLYTFADAGVRSIFIVADQGLIVTDPVHAAAAHALRAEIAAITDATVLTLGAPVASKAVMVEVRGYLE